jgi:two-component system, NtrC family, nitrogen regulation response regulator NtrX
MGVVEWQPFERGRRSLLAAPMEIAAGVHAVIELFDKQDGRSGAVSFSQADLELTAAAADFGTALLRQALAERQSQEILLDAVTAAIRAGETVAQTLSTGAAAQPQPHSDPVLEQFRQSLSDTPTASVAAEESVRLAEAVRRLAVNHGRPAVEHCIRLVESLRGLLDSVTGSGEPQL